MKLEDVLLTDAELDAIYDKWLDTEGYGTARSMMVKAQCLKLLDVLVKNKYVKGHEQWRGLDFHGEWRCQINCKLCEIEKLLKEG